MFSTYSSNIYKVIDITGTMYIYKEFLQKININKLNYEIDLITNLIHPCIIRIHPNIVNEIPKGYIMIEGIPMDEFKFTHIKQICALSKDV